jgi:organic hydroperoxide reductase OsmC/OhrA
MKRHTYETRVDWTGNDGAGTKNYRAYRRDHTITSAGKPPIPGSSDPSFRGDPARHNPEELLVASLSSCHMLWYLHLCAVNRVNVLAYHDDATGHMDETADGTGAFVSVTLRPAATISADSDPTRALLLHADAHRFCFISQSVNFPVAIEPMVTLSAP